MNNKKRSFFERLTGAINTEEDESFGNTPMIPTPERSKPKDDPAAHEPKEEHGIMEENEEDAQLTVDMYQTPGEIIIKTIVAGVEPSELDVTIARDMVTISGRRQEIHEVTEEDYFHRELYWGGFSRTILLPEEVDVEQSDATEKHGVMTLRLPKIDKQMKTKLSVKAG